MPDINYNTKSHDNLAVKFAIFILEITYHLNLSKSNMILFFDEGGKLENWEKPLFDIFCI